MGVRFYSWEYNVVNSIKSELEESPLKSNHTGASLLFSTSQKVTKNTTKMQEILHTIDIALAL
jgi:nitrous oxidase accessory protein NosD